MLLRRYTSDEEIKVTLNFHRKFIKEDILETGGGGEMKRYFQWILERS
jgi:hypothetical protein